MEGRSQNPSLQRSPAPSPRLALAFVHALDPFTQAVGALDQRYGQPRQLALRELRSIMDMTAIRVGDGRALDQFAVQALVGLLQGFLGFL